MAQMSEKLLQRVLTSSEKYMLGTFLELGVTVRVDVVPRDKDPQIHLTVADDSGVRCASASLSELTRSFKTEGKGITVRDFATFLVRFCDWNRELISFTPDRLSRFQKVLGDRKGAAITAGWSEQETYWYVTMNMWPEQRSADGAD